MGKVRINSIIFKSMNKNLNVQTEKNAILQLEKMNYTTYAR